MTPAARAALIEAGITLATMAIMLAVIRYGPDLAAAARLAYVRHAAGPAGHAGYAQDELAVSDFRSELAGPAAAAPAWAATSTGWEHEL